MNYLFVAILACMAVTLHCRPQQANETSVIKKQFTISVNDDCKTYKLELHTKSETTNGQTVTASLSGIPVCTVEECNKPATVTTITCEEYQKINETRAVFTIPTPSPINFPTFAPIQFPTLPPFQFPTFPTFPPGWRRLF